MGKEDHYRIIGKIIVYLYAKLKAKDVSHTEVIYISKYVSELFNKSGKGNEIIAEANVHIHRGDMNDVVLERMVKVVLEDDA